MVLRKVAVTELRTVEHDVCGQSLCVAVANFEVAGVRGSVCDGGRPRVSGGIVRLTVAVSDQCL